MTDTTRQDGAREGKEIRNDTDASAMSRKPLSPAAQRALAEAQERRVAQEQRARELAQRKELGGREGPDPVRYSDWENNGIASDF